MITDIPSFETVFHNGSQETETVRSMRKDSLLRIKFLTIFLSIAFQLLPLNGSIVA